MMRTTKIGPAQAATQPQIAVTRPRPAVVSGPAAGSGRGALALVRGNSPGLCGELLGRADSHLFAAMSPGDSSERFLRAYQAALRGAGALLASVEPVGKRMAERSAWIRLAKIVEFARWAEYFRSVSGVRAMLQAGAGESFPEQQVQAFVRAVGQFLDDIEDFLRLEKGASSVPRHAAKEVSGAGPRAKSA